MKRRIGFLRYQPLLYLALIWSGSELFAPIYLILLPLSIFNAVMSLLKMNQAINEGRALKFYVCILYFVFSIFMFVCSVFMIGYTADSDYYRNPLIVTLMLIIPIILCVFIAARQNGFENSKQAFANVYKSLLKRPWI